MKTYYFVVTGALIAKVKGKTKNAAETNLDEWLQEHSPIRDWEVDFELNYADERPDIVVPAKPKSE